MVANQTATTAAATLIFLAANLLATNLPAADLATQRADAAERPNVVLIMTDDQGYGDLGCHGNAVLKTPALDALHGESIRLTNYHVDPTCSPTRAALLTGRYSSRTGVWHTIMGRSIMHPEEFTLGELFQANGYRTGAFGKWHLGDNHPCRPQDQGFGEVLVHGGGGVGQTPDYWGNDYFDDVYWRNGKPAKQTGYCTDVFFEAATSFIESNKDRPFFCYLPTNAAHGPFLVAKKYSEPYKQMGVPSPRAEFYGMIANIDENVARLRKKLKELGLAENTILIFTTDNGTAAGTHRGPRKKRKPATPKQKAGKATAVDARDADDRAMQIRNGFNAGLRGTKGSEYDGGHRVPFFVHWPKGNMIGGRDVDELAAHIDVFPTLAALCGLNSPAKLPIDGASLANPLRGVEREERPARTLFVHSQRIERPKKWRKAAVMTNRWRLVTDGNRRELFDMAADRGQRNDVKADYPEIVKRLSAAYEKWYADVGGRFDDYVDVTLGSTEENPARLTCHDWHTDDGPVPWHQNAVRNDQRANGFWAVNVVEAGTYKITLRTRPEQANAVVPAGKARLKIGGIDESRPVPRKSTAMTFRVKLSAGRTKLQTWLEDESGKSRGAYFVDVRRVK